MTFVSALLSLKAKNPRKGLYLSTALGMAFIVPALIIVYLPGANLMWAVVCSACMLVADALLCRKISLTSRPSIMEAL